MATSLQIALLAVTVVGAVALAGLLVSFERYRAAQRRARVLEGALNPSLRREPGVERPDPLDWLPSLALAGSGLAFLIMGGYGSAMGLLFGVFFLAATWFVRPTARRRRRRLGRAEESPEGGVPSPRTDR